MNDLANYNSTDDSSCEEDELQRDLGNHRGNWYAITNLGKPSFL
jgi:hypothetical protein